MHYEDDKADTTKRDKGTLFHSLMDQYIKTGEVDLSVVPVGWEDVLTWYRHGKAYFDNVIRGNCQWVMSEVAMQVNFYTGDAVILADVVNREYPERDGYINGTADLIYLTKSDVLVVADWKTGSTAGADKQLLSLLLGYVMSVFGPPPLEEMPLLTETLSVNERGVWPVGDQVTASDLREHGLAMAKAQAENTVKQGAHCTALYCPHLAYCDEVMGSVLDLSEGTQGLLPASALLRNHRLTDRPTSDQEAGWVMSRLSAAKRQVGYYEEAMKQYVSKGGRVVDGDLEWSKTSTGHRWGKRK